MGPLAMVVCICSWSRLLSLVLSGMVIRVDPCCSSSPKDACGAKPALAE